MEIGPVLREKGFCGRMFQRALTGLHDALTTWDDRISPSFSTLLLSLAFSFESDDSMYAYNDADACKACDHALLGSRAQIRQTS
jgi:hypothetical protein